MQKRVEKANGEERKDAISFHTAKVMTTLNAPVRKEIASFLQEPYTYHKGLFAVNSVKAFCHLTRVTTAQYSHNTGFAQEKGQSKGVATRGTNIQLLFKMCSVAMNFTDTSSSSK